MRERQREPILLQAGRAGSFSTFGAPLQFADHTLQEHASGV
jgi:hypothetical protein